MDKNAGLQTEALRMSTLFLQKWMVKSLLLLLWKEERPDLRRE